MKADVTQTLSANPTQPGFLSFSRLNTYNGCGEKYRLRYIEKADSQPQGAFIGGIAVHDAIAHAEGKGLWRTPEGIEEAQEYGLRRFTELMDEQTGGGKKEVRWGGRKTREWDMGEDSRWWRWFLPVAVKRYAEVRQADDQNGAKVTSGGVEMEVLAPLPNGWQIKGYIDAFLMATPDGEMMIRDWKTGRPGGNDALQLATYAWALEKAGVSAPNLGQYVYLKSNDSKKMFSTHDLAPLKPIVERLYMDLAKGIEAKVFAIKPSNFCISCGVKAACQYGRLLGE